MTNENDQTLLKVAKFCHECGFKYPVADVKFCTECGVRRIVSWIIWGYEEKRITKRLILVNY